MIQEITNALVAEIAIMTDGAPADIDINKPLPELDIDSLQTLQLIVLLERTFGVQIDESDLQHFSTVSNIAEFVNQRLSSAVPVPNSGNVPAVMESYQ